jgi:hypothetical protein
MNHPFIIDSSGKLKRKMSWFSAAVLKAKQEIVHQEDVEIFKALNSIFEIEYK